MLLVTIELAKSSLEAINITVHFTFVHVLSHSCRRSVNQSTLEDPNLVQTVRRIAASSTSPFELCEQGTGGTYFVKNTSGARIAVFKPADEEPGSHKNPKKIVENPLLAPGGGAVREVVAYALDHGNKAGVPETHFLKDLCHSYWTEEKRIEPKSGSLQKYIPHFSTAADMGSSLFSVEDVHNLGVFDVRLLNLDRNGENILVVKEGAQHRLVPIDHSYILPPSVQKPFFEWLYWKQAKEPFSAATLKYISDLNIEEDARVLFAHGFSAGSIKTMKMCTILLKKCAAAGMTLFQIASLVSSRNEMEDSTLESIVREAEHLSEAATFFSVFESLVDSLVGKNICK